MRWIDCMKTLIGAGTQAFIELAPGKVLCGLLKQIGGIEGLPQDKRITRRGYYYYLMRFCKEEFNGLPPLFVWKTKHEFGYPS